MDTLPPPTKYDHRYAGPVIEMVLTGDQADRLCRRMGQSHSGIGQFAGCSWRDHTERCFIVLSGDSLDALRRHEIAHCNGWSADHRLK